MIMRAKTTVKLSLLSMLALAFSAQAGLVLPSRWVHGAPHEQTLQVHEAAPGFWILRQSKRSNFEAPFLYLIAGKESALLLDSGATPEDGRRFPLRETVDRVLGKWRKSNPQCTGLIVAHTHSHRDHIAGDDQFRGRPHTRVIGTNPADVAAFFGLSRWPDGQAQLDLGGRQLLVLPLPGHEASHIAIYDPATHTLLSGDSLYPGMLTVRNLDEYRGSLERLVQFARQHRIDQVLGAHIEMTTTTQVMYPLGTQYQPEEHALALTADHIQELALAVRNAGDFRNDIVRDDFIVHRILEKRD